MAKAAPKSTASAFSFASAIVKAAPPKSGSKTVEHFVDRTADIAALKHMKDLIESAIEEVGDQFEQDAMGYYLKGCNAETGTKPANFTSTESGHTVTSILGKRRSNSVLTDEEAMLLDDHKIPYDTTGAEDTFEFNNEVLAKPELRAQIEAFIGGLKVPDGMVVIQKNPGKAKRVVTEDTVAAVFRLPAETAELLLPVVTTFSMRAKWQVVANNMAPLVDRVGRLLNLPGMVEKLNALTEKRSKKRQQWAA